MIKDFFKKYTLFDPLHIYENKITKNFVTIINIDKQSNNLFIHIKTQQTFFSKTLLMDFHLFIF